MKRYTSLFYLMTLANFLFFLGNASYILLPVFLKNLGASESYIGVLNNVDKTVTIISAAGIGWFMHGRDRIRLLRTGYFCLLIAFSSYLLISSLTWWLLAIRILHGIGFTIAIILSSTMIFDIVPIKNAAEAIGIYGISGAISNAISPYFGELLLNAGYSHHVIFFISVVLVSMSICTTFIMSREYSPSGSRKKNERKDGQGMLDIMKNNRFIAVALATFIFGGSYGVILTYLPNFIRTTTGFKFSYFFLVYISVLILIRFTLGIINRFDKKAVITSAFLIGAVTNIFLNFLNSYTMLVIIGIMYGITHGILYPMLNSTAVEMVKHYERDKANALFIGFFYGGMMAFALSLGFLIDYYNNYLVAFNVCAGAFIFGIIIRLIISAGFLKSY